MGKCFGILVGFASIKCIIFRTSVNKSPKYTFNGLFITLFAVLGQAKDSFRT